MWWMEALRCGTFGLPLADLEINASLSHAGMVIVKRAWAWTGASNQLPFGLVISLASIRSTTSTAFLDSAKSGYSF